MTTVLSGYAKKAYRETRRFARVVGRFSLEREARHLLGELGRPRADGPTISEEKGWARFDARKLRGLDVALDRLREIGEGWAANEERWVNQKSLPYELTRTEDLLSVPEIMDVALHEDLLRAASSYLEQVPRIASLAIWWSPPNDTLRGSQLFHYDHRDSRQPKLFVNLRESTAESGPLHFLGADQSRQFDAKVGYSQGRIADEQVFSMFRPDELHSTAGAAGEAFFVDTGRCLHYGSRGNSVGRLMFMVNYTRVNCSDPKKGSALDPVRQQIADSRYSGDAVRSFVLTAPV